MDRVDSLERLPQIPYCSLVYSFLGKPLLCGRCFGLSHQQNIFLSVLFSTPPAGLLPSYSILSLLVALCRIDNGPYRHEGLNTLMNRIVTSSLPLPSCHLFFWKTLCCEYIIFIGVFKMMQKCIFHLSAHMTGDPAVRSRETSSRTIYIRWLLLGNSCACAVCLNTA